MYLFSILCCVTSEESVSLDEILEPPPRMSHQLSQIVLQKKEHLSINLDAIATLRDAISMVTSA